MARADHNDKIPKIQAEWRTGHYSQRDLAKKHNVSVGFVSKWLKDIPQDAADAVNGGVLYKQTLASDNEHLVNAVNTVVDERVKHLMFFTNSALRNQQLANKKLNENLPITDLEAHSRITARNKETVLGKQPDTAIQINNTNTSENPASVLNALNRKYNDT
jgi:hypothetical protein